MGFASCVTDANMRTSSAVNARRSVKTFPTSREEDGGDDEDVDVDADAVASTRGRADAIGENARGDGPKRFARRRSIIAAVASARSVECR
jgi:hypothetical protein